MRGKHIPRGLLVHAFGSPLIFTRFHLVLTGILYKCVISARSAYRLTLIISLSSADTSPTTFVSSNDGRADASFVVGFAVAELARAGDVPATAYLSKGNLVKWRGQSRKKSVSFHV